MLLEQVEQRGDGLAMNFLRLEQGTAIVRDAINAPLHFVAVGVAQVVLHVADDRVMPIGEIDRAIGTDADRGRAEVRIA